MRSFTALIVMMMLGIGSFSLHAKKGARWYDLAEGLSGVTELDYNKTLKRLRANAGLSSLLKSQLQKAGPYPDTKTFLALDVIGALRLQKMLPMLIKYTERDRSGYAYHTINALVSDQNRASIESLYRERLTSAHISPAAKLAVIDTLARLNSVLQVNEVKALLHDPVFDVRAAALSYIRNFVINGTHSEYIPLIQIPVEQGPRRLKAQAEFLSQEILSRKKNNL